MPNPRAVKEISIHALREEGDHRSLFRSAQKIDFYPRPPRGGRPTSSLPSWRGGNFYPRPPRGGRLGQHTEGGGRFLFLSTPSARRATLPAAAIRSVIDDFYPRPPRGGRRDGFGQIADDTVISIHALREEGDRLSRMAASSSPYFYPRPPRGGRPTTWTTRPRHRKFLSTPSARRATSFAYAGKLLFPISIHALREEGDSLIPPRTLPRWNFYPRPPRGGRQKVYDLTGYSVEFLSTPSARRATAPKTSSLVGALSFLSTPSARRATSIAFIKLDMACYFYPRPPRGGRPAPQL